MILEIVTEDGRVLRVSAARLLVKAPRWGTPTIFAADHEGVVAYSTADRGAEFEQMLAEHGVTLSTVFRPAPFVPVDRIRFKD